MKIASDHNFHLSPGRRDPAERSAGLTPLKAGTGFRQVKKHPSYPSSSAILTTISCFEHHSMERWMCYHVLLWLNTLSHSKSCLEQLCKGSSVLWFMPYEGRKLKLSGPNLSSDFMDILQGSLPCPSTSLSTHSSGLCTNPITHLPQPALSFCCFHHHILQGSVFNSHTIIKSSVKAASVSSHSHNYNGWENCSQKYPSIFSLLDANASLYENGHACGWDTMATCL